MPTKQQLDSETALIKAQIENEVAKKRLGLLHNPPKPSTDCDLMEAVALSAEQKCLHAIQVHREEQMQAEHTLLEVKTEFDRLVKLKEFHIDSIKAIKDRFAGL